MLSSECQGCSHATEKSPRLQGRIGMHLLDSVTLRDHHLVLESLTSRVSVLELPGRPMVLNSHLLKLWLHYSRNKSQQTQIHSGPMSEDLDLNTEAAMEEKGEAL